MLNQQLSELERLIKAHMLAPRLEVANGVSAAHAALRKEVIVVPSISDEEIEAFALKPTSEVDNEMLEMGLDLPENLCLKEFFGWSPVSQVIRI